MQRCWLLEPLKDKIETGDKFVYQIPQLSTKIVLGLSLVACAQVGEVVPNGWIVIRAMKNEKRRAKRGFVATIFKRVFELKTLTKRNK